jgi:hypothetical protein
MMVEGNSVLWTMLGQAAQALNDPELVEVVTACHDRSAAGGVCNATIKSLSPQALTAR